MNFSKTKNFQLSFSFRETSFFLGHFVAIVTVFVFSGTMFVSAQSGSVLNRNLSLGARGEDVVKLQKILNIDVETQVSSIGAGSKGQESEYFGLKTKDAVKRFQWKYRSEVLYPSGLSQATGFVGVATRKKLLDLSETKVNLPVNSGVVVPKPEIRPNPEVSLPSTPVIPEPVSGSPVPDTSGGNPNLVNLDKFLSTVEKVGKDQGFTDARLSVIKEGIKTTIATTTNFREEFNKARVRSRAAQASASKISKPFALGDLFKGLLTSLGILPKVANAQLGLPFGGREYFIFFCPCSGNWLIAIEPLPPTYVNLLTYYEGTQEFANYNAPFTFNLLGFYSPGGICEEYVGIGCATIPSEGFIYGFIGSSAI